MIVCPDCSWERRLVTTTVFNHEDVVRNQCCTRVLIVVQKLIALRPCPQRSIARTTHTSDLRMCCKNYLVQMGNGSVYKVCSEITVLATVHQSFCSGLIQRGEEAFRISLRHPPRRDRSSRSRKASSSSDSRCGCIPIPLLGHVSLLDSAS